MRDAGNFICRGFVQIVNVNAVFSPDLAVRWRPQRGLIVVLEIGRDLVLISSGHNFFILHLQFLHFHFFLHLNQP